MASRLRDDFRKILFENDTCNAIRRAQPRRNQTQGIGNNASGGKEKQLLICLRVCLLGRLVAYSFSHRIFRDKKFLSFISDNAMKTTCEKYKPVSCGNQLLLHTTLSSSSRLLMPLFLLMFLLHFHLRLLYF